MPPGSQAALAAVDAEPAVLRVMAGPQRGAELPLHPGDYLVGSGEQCDAVIADPAVAEAHVLLSYGGDAVTVAAREKSVALADRILRPGEEASVSLPAVATFGLTSIAIGTAGTDWFGLTLPDPPAAEAPPKASPEAEDSEAGAAAEDSDAAAEAADSKAEEDGEESGDAEAAESEDGGDAAKAAAPGVETQAAPEAPAEQAAAEALPATRRRRWLWIVPLLLLLLAVTAFFVLRGPMMQGADAEAESAAAAAVSPHDRAVALVESLGLSEISVERSPTGSPVLTGYVPDAGTHMELTLALQSAELQADDRTRDVEALMDAVALTLGSFSWPEPGFGAHLRPSYGGNGVVVIDGYLGPEVDRGVLRRRLQGDVPGISNLEFRRSGLMEWKSILDRRLTEAGLGQWLIVEPAAGMLRISGEVTAQEAHAWRAVGQGFVNESGGWPKLAIAVTSAEPPANPTLPAPAAISAADAPVVGPEQIVKPEPVVDLEHPSVIGVILSQKGPGRVLLAGGLSLLEGDILENGMAVKSVMADKVVFGSGERELVVYVKESR